MGGLFSKLIGKNDESSGSEDFTVNQFDKVLLKDGRIAHIYTIFKPGVTYDAEIFLADGSSVSKTIKHRDIARVFPKPDYTVEQKKALIACCILMQPNVELYATTVFEIPKELNAAAPEFGYDLLRENWGIVDREEALRVINYLSKAEGHTPVANEIYREYIIKSNLNPLNADTFDINYGFPDIIKSSRIRAEDLIPSYMEENNIPPEHKDEVWDMFTKLFYIDRVNKGMTGYAAAMNYLAGFGVTKNEVLKISNFAAWDYGRCGFIARFSAHNGYINESEAWSYMLTAANNAAKGYDTWREYLIAYVVGRFIAYGQVEMELFDVVIKWLLTDESSFYNRIPLK